MMLRGLQAVFEANPLPQADILLMQGLGVEAYRLHFAPWVDDDDPRILACIRQAEDSGMRPCYVVERDTTIWKLPAGSWAVLSVEPDIRLNNQPWTIGTYATMATKAQIAARQAGVRLFIGAVSNLGIDQQTWLRQILLRVPGAEGVCFDRYPVKSQKPFDGQDGFKSRAAETAALLDLIGGRPYIVTEFGFHTGPFNPGGFWGWLGLKRRLSEQQQLDFTRYDFNYWATHGALAAFLYQLNDGKTDDWGSRFGIRRVDGSLKPVAQVFRRGT